MTLTLDSLREELLQWDGCTLSKSANAVLGEGNPHADVFFVGEAPGAKEDELKRPFVGAAGQMLDSLLAKIGIQRSDVYISNVVKYRPPNNRDPEPIEKEQCMPWLMLELALIKPKVIVPLGRHALGHFFPSISITNAHGRAFKLTDDITVFPIYHPAAALHNGNLRSGLESDFLGLGEHLKSRGLLQKAA